MSFHFGGTLPNKFNISHLPFTVQHSQTFTSNLATGYHGIKRWIKFPVRHWTRRLVSTRMCTRQILFQSTVRN